MPPTNTSVLLKKLRGVMCNPECVDQAIDAYIIPSGDAHSSEYTAECDKRRQFISGFTGTAGTAVVTQHQAAMWTDGRYYQQSRSQMDSNWELVKEGLPEAPTQAEWLCEVLPPGGRVGVDPLLLPASAWDPLLKELKSNGHTLVAVTHNLVDLIWDDKPVRPTNGVFPHSSTITGQSWQEKVTLVRQKMQKKTTSALLLTALDEVAWLLNLRGSDISCNPVFFSYVLVTENKVMLFMDERKLSKEATMTSQFGIGGVELLPYDDVRSKLADTVDSTEAEGRIWTSPHCNHALVSIIPEERRLTELTPVCLMKAIKNPTEVKGMRNAHVKDAIALCEYFMWLEAEVPKAYLTEITAADHLLALREQQDGFVSLSFPTKSSVGPNGAIIHYLPTKETDRLLTTEDLYLCDAGAHYKDGTTDVTRTVHFGTPSHFEQEVFTRVLKGHIAISTVRFPKGTKGHRLDCLARVKLWDVGLDYQHGTGHGVGHVLNVHEGPCAISYKTRPEEVGLKENMIISNEPGFYLDGKFGIRIENLVVVKRFTTLFQFKNTEFLTFEPITVVPIQRKMILPSLLAESEIKWLNDYHSTCRQVIGAELRNQGKKDVFQWLLKQTEPIE